MTATAPSAATTATPPKLRISGLIKDFGTTRAVDEVSLDVAEGELVALLGPSGCGKTTTLRMVAGLESPTDGLIEIDGRVVSRGGWSMPAEGRGLGMVFQSYALWPHMTVFKNVAFGLANRGLDKDAIKRRTLDTLASVGMDTYAERYPGQLSGGQQQRVALARALATQPSILLLDEPLSNLDANLRESMRFEIRDVQQRLGMTSIYVTHSQEEALALADRIAVMRSGRMIQIGSPEEMYFRPQSGFAARVIGLANVWSGTVVELDGERATVRLSDDLVVRGMRVAPTIAVDTEVDVMVRPEHISLSVDDDGTPAGAPAPEDNELIGSLTKASYTGSIVDYFATVAGLRGETRVQATPPILTSHPGAVLRLRFNASRVVVMHHDV